MAKLGWMTFQAVVFVTVTAFCLKDGLKNGFAAAVVGMVAAALATAILFEVKFLPARISSLFIRSRHLLRREPGGDDLSLPRVGRCPGELPEQVRRPRISHD